MASLYKKPVIIRDPKTGRKTKTKSKKWWGRYRDVTGKEKRVPLATDRVAAQAMLNDIVRRAERERAGLVEPTDEHRKRPLPKHLADYERHLRAKENAPRYVAMALGRVNAVIAGCRFRTIGEFSASKVANWLRTQRESGHFGKATSNDYLVAIKAFCNWLVRDGRLARNPLSHLQRLNTETDVRRERRVLSPDELGRLIAAAEWSPLTIDRCTGRDRATLYRLAAITGLRAQELASLTPSSFDLDGTPPTVCVEACYSKRRRTDILPLADELVSYLRDFLASRSNVASDQRLWPGRWYRKAARMLHRDLGVAREAWLQECGAEQGRSDFLRIEDQDGRVADFHALRHGFITYLVTANVPPKVAQALARHSTITLTMDRYAHLSVLDLTDAVGRLPSVASHDQRASKDGSVTRRIAAS